MDPRNHNSSYPSVQQLYQSNSYPNNAYLLNPTNQRPSYPLNSQPYNNNTIYEQIPQNSVNQYYNNYNNQLTNNQHISNYSHPQQHRQVIGTHYNVIPNTYTQPQQNNIYSSNYNNPMNNNDNNNNNYNLNAIYQPDAYSNINQSNKFYASHNNIKPQQITNHRYNNDSIQSRQESIIRVPIGTATRTSTAQKVAFASSKESHERHNSFGPTITKLKSPIRNNNDANNSRSAINIKKNGNLSNERNIMKRQQSPPTINTVITDAKKNRILNLYDYSKGAFANSFNFPAINRDCSLLDTPGILSRYNRFKVPDDFVKMDIDWNLLSKEVFTQSMNSNKISKLNESVCIYSIFKPSEFNSNSDLLSQDYNKPQFTVTNNASYNTKDVRYNAKILITCGYTKECESLDHSFCKNLRMLFGTISEPQLLGTSWCKELDGGDPNIDRSCLLNTARRAVLSQSLIDIFTDCNDTVKLCEIVYSRPKGYSHGSEYKEINVIYLCSLSTDKIKSVDFELKWSLFHDRLHGKSMQPILNLNIYALNTKEEIYSCLVKDKSYIRREAVDKDIEKSSSIIPSDLIESNNTEGMAKKPEMLCVLICPQPISQDINSDSSNQKKTLSILTVNEMLTHSAECSSTSELLFEAIMAVEMLRSIICIHFANIIVSFILSEHETLSVMIDSYVVNTMKKLRQINSKIITIVNSKNDEIINNTNNINNSEIATSETIENVKNKKSKVDLDEITTIDFEINRDPVINIDVKTIPDDPLNNYAEISEAEARGWRRNFLNSCKWFDKDQSSCISIDILEMIFYISDIPVTREISQNELFTICYKLCNKLCKEEKKLIFNYESFV